MLSYLRNPRALALLMTTLACAAPFGFVVPQASARIRTYAKSARYRTGARHWRTKHDRPRRKLHALTTAKAATSSASGLPSVPAVASKPASTRSVTAPGKVLFDGSSLSGWQDESAAANRVTVVNDPAGGSDEAMKFVTYNSDVYPLTPTNNPRAQVITNPNVVTEGVPFWESYEVYLPASFPTVQPANSWIALGSPFYGAPWSGSPSVEMQIENGAFVWRSNANAQVPGQILWQMPVQTRTWIRFTWYIVPATNGFAELYVNGAPVSVTYNGVTANGVHIPVVDAFDSTGPWESQLQLYYGAGEFSSLTAYFKDFMIATTQSAAEQS
jgi:hypothetical protein